jgi:hypothetical protein
MSTRLLPGQDRLSPYDCTETQDNSDEKAPSRVKREIFSSHIVAKPQIQSVPAAARDVAQDMQPELFGNALGAKHCSNGRAEAI